MSVPAIEMPRKSLHPTFQKKRVVELSCRYCGNVVCDRGMKAILLADTAVELYSTDLAPERYETIITLYLIRYISGGNA